MKDLCAAIGGTEDVDEPGNSPRSGLRDHKGNGGRAKEQRNDGVRVRRVVFGEGSGRIVVEPIARFAGKSRKAAEGRIPETR